MAKKDLPKPEGICPYCGKEVYKDLNKHVLICKLESRSIH